MKNKIPFYNNKNMFFVGSVFSFIIVTLFHKHFQNIDLSSTTYIFMKEWSVVISAVLLIAMYEIGFILNKAGSILIEPILSKTNVWPKYEYDKDVSEISENNSKFQAMITELVLMRTHILLYLLLAVISLFSPYKWFSLICIFLIVIFILAGRKHNSKINKIRESTAKEDKKTKKLNSEMRSLMTYDGTTQKKV